MFLTAYLDRNWYLIHFKQRFCIYHVFIWYKDINCANLYRSFPKNAKELKKPVYCTNSSLGIHSLAVTLYFKMRLCFTPWGPTASVYAAATTEFKDDLSCTKRFWGLQMKKFLYQQRHWTFTYRLYFHT